MKNVISKTLILKTIIEWFSKCYCIKYQFPNRLFHSPYLPQPLCRKLWQWSCTTWGLECFSIQKFNYLSKRSHFKNTVCGGSINSKRESNDSNLWGLLKSREENRKQKCLGRFPVQLYWTVLSSLIGESIHIMNIQVFSVIHKHFNTTSRR